MNYFQDERPFRDHRGSPPLSVYLMSDDSSKMERINCLWCKRTINDIKGTITTIIGTPMPVDQFDIAINTRCKLCHQDYRFLVQSQIIQG